MPVLPRLLSLYEGRGFTVSTGLNPLHHEGAPLAPFTWLLRDGKPFTNGLGIALQEIYFLECLFAEFHPRSMFAIGNSFGFSTIALALLNPQARVVAIDSGFDQNALEGIALTRTIAEAAGLDVAVAVATSPGDVAATVAAHAAGPPEFAFVDGYHSNEQIVTDFEAVRAAAAPGCTFLFHDVHQFRLHQGLAEVQRRAAPDGYRATVLYATTSGMALLHRPGTAALDAVAHAFAGDASARAVIVEAFAAEGRRRRGRLFRRLSRSVRKRLGGSRASR